MSQAALKQTRSPEREALAQAIAERNAAEAAAAHVADAKSNADATRMHARSRMDAAARALTEAKQNEGRRLAAVALGETTDTPSMGEAQLALEQATNDYEIARNTAAALAQRLDEAVSRARRADDLLNEARAAVVKNEARALIAEQEAVCKRLAELTHTFTFLSESQCNPLPRWGFDPQAADAACIAPWRMALDALRSDPDASLP